MGASTQGDTDDWGRLDKALIVVAVVALAVRIIYFAEHVGTPGYWVPTLDGLYYHLFAAALAEGSDLGVFGGFRPVLYPAFLAVIYTVVGVEAGPAVAPVIQHFLGVVTNLLVAGLAWQLSGHRVSSVYLAGFLYALAGPVVYMEGELLIESLMAFLCAGMLVAAGAALRLEGKRACVTWIISGLLAALAAQARPNMVLTYPIFGLLAVALLIRYGPAKGLSVGCAIIAIIATQVTFGFVNQAQSGRFQLMTGAGGINFYVGNNTRADGVTPRAAYSSSVEGTYRDSIQVFAEVEGARRMLERGLEPTTDAGALSSFWYREAWSDIAADPVRWIGLMGRKAWLSLGNPELASGDSFRFAATHESFVLRLLVIRWWVVMFLLPAGVFAIWQANRRALLALVLGFTALYLLSFILFFVNGRFRIPVWPGMIAVAGVGASWLVVRALSKWGRRMLGLGAFMAVASASASWIAPRENFAMQFYFQSIAYYQLGLNQEAMRTSQLAIELEEPTGARLAHGGNVALAMGDPAMAVLWYGRSLTLEPDEPGTWNNLGQALEGLEKYRDALIAYERALGLRPHHRQALLNAAALELRAGRVKSAQERLGKLERYHPERMAEASILMVQAFLARADGDREKAATFESLARVRSERTAGEWAEKLQTPVTLED